MATEANVRMRIGDKELLILVAIGIVILLLLLARRHVEVAPGGGTTIAVDNGCEEGNPWCVGDPTTWINSYPNFTFNDAPFEPPNINTTIYGFGGIGNYFPMFGFVGVDTTQIYQ